MGTRYEQLVDEQAVEKRDGLQAKAVFDPQTWIARGAFYPFSAASGWSWVGDRESPIAWGDGFALSLA